MGSKLSGVMVSACLLCAPIAAAQTVTYNYARGVNFDAFRSFKWITIEGATATDPILDKNIKEAIEVALRGRALVKSESNSELLIAYQVSDRREKNIQMSLVEGFERYGPGWHYGDTYGYSHGYSFVSSPAMSTATDSVIPVGNLVVDIYDGAYGDLVWRGEVSKALTSKPEPDARLRDLRKAVEKLFEAFP